jgi:hypothetical protein
LLENLQALSTALVGVALVSAALQGYLIGVGDLGRGGAAILVRVMTAVSGLTLALPAGGLFGFSQILLLMVAAVALAVAVTLHRLVVAPGLEPIQGASP